MKACLHRCVCTVLITLLSCSFLKAQVIFRPDSVLGAGLPRGIQVLRGSGTQGGTAIRAVLTIFDPSQNPQLELDLAVGNNQLFTPQQHAARETERVWVTLNGGFFGGTASNSHVMKNGVLATPGVKTVARTLGTYFPTRAALGLDSVGRPGVHWMYNVGTANTPYIYPAPSPNNVTLPPQPQPTATFPTGGSIWNAYTAMGGGPMLIRNGQKLITDTAELFDAASGVDPRGLAPRTAMGYDAAGKFYLLVVDGRATGFAGASMDMLADLFLQLGCTNAIALDGGGSSAIVVNGTVANVPSDAAGVRPVSSVWFVKQKNWVYDTEVPSQYQEIGATFSETANAGFFGPSRARFTSSGTGSVKAYYLLKNLPSASYQLSGWWVAASNRSNRTPFIIRRRGQKADTVYANQSINGSRWNLLGSYQLSASDTIEVNNAGQPGALITTDAIQLVQDGEARPSIRFNQDAAQEIVKDSAFTLSGLVLSVNAGVQIKRIQLTRIFNQQETQVGDTLLTNASDSLRFSFSLVANEPIGSQVFLRLRITDTSGIAYDSLVQYTVTPLTQIVFSQTPAGNIVEKGKRAQIIASLSSRSATTQLRTLRIFKRVNNGLIMPADSVPQLTGTSATHIFTDTIGENVNDFVEYIFRLTDSNNDTATKRYTAQVLPGVGNFRIAVISDLNSSFGDTTYEWQVDSILQRIPRIWKPDMVVSGGDLIAGQSTGYDSARVAAMWNAFDRKVAEPLRLNNIAHAFTMGNHDAAAGFTNDRIGARNYWRRAGSFPGWHPIDTSNYPYYHSFQEKPNGEFFFVSWEASDANLSQADTAWAVQQFQRPEAQQARYKILIGHMPFYGVAQERDGVGNILTNGDALRKRMEDLGVRLYVSGHHHAYYPGMRGNMELLNAGAAGSGPRKWTFGDETAPNTVTIMDFFHDRDSIVYTTYEIASRSPQGMTVFNEKRLPAAIFGTNGFTRNRSVQVNAEGAGILSRYHLTDSITSSATGFATVTSASAASITIQGQFTNLSSPILSTPDAVALYASLHPLKGNIVGRFQVQSVDGKTGSFTANIPVDGRKELLELLSVGALYIQINTINFPNGELRTQLYKNSNAGPAAAVINTQNADSLYLIRNIPAFFGIGWTVNRDPDLHALVYTYQLARDSSFAQIVYEKNTGVGPRTGLTQQTLWNLLDTVAPNQTVVFYHRVISSDGKAIIIAPPQKLQLAKTNLPPTGNIELQSPAYVYDCAGKDADGNCVDAFSNSNAGHGVVVDKMGKVWYHPFSAGLYVRNANGSFYQPTSNRLRFSMSTAPTTYLSAWQPGAMIRQVILGSDTFNISSVTGLGLANDGGILLAAGSALYKLDPVTGEPLRRVALGSLGLSNPTMDSAGNIFVTRVLNNQSFLLRESATRANGFDTVLSQFAVPDYPGTTRASAISYEGNALYLPSAGGSFVNRYLRQPNNSFVLDRRIPLQGTCNSIHVKPGNKLFVVSNRSGNVPPILEYRDFTDTTQIQSWSFPLAETPLATDLRGLSMNEAADTFYVTSLGVFRVFRYHIPGAGSVANADTGFAPEYRIAAVKPVKPNGVADSLGLRCALRGTVQMVKNRNAADMYDFTMQDGSAGIQVFSLRIKNGVQVNVGDSIWVRGRISQAYGQIFMAPDSMMKLTTNGTNYAPVVTDSLVENMESSKVKLGPVMLAVAGFWPASPNVAGTEITVMNRANRNAEIRLFASANAHGSVYPKGEFLATGIAAQFDAQIPFTTGYSLHVTDTGMLQYTNITATDTILPLADSFRILPTHIGYGTAADSLVLEMSDSLGNFATATSLDTVLVNETTLSLAANKLGSGTRKIRLRSLATGLRSNAIALTASAVLSNASIRVTATRSGNNTLVQWTIPGLETGLRSRVEYSANGNDFFALALQQTTTLQAQFLHRNAPLAAGFYRIKLLYANGSFVYSQVAKVDAQGHDMQLRIYPNPARNTLFVSHSASTSGKVQIRVVNTYGQSVIQLSGIRMQPGQTQSVNISSLKPGTYFLEWMANGEKTTKSFVKE